MSRFGEPEELIGALLLLVSPEGRQLHHRHARQRRRRLHGRVVLSKAPGLRPGDHVEAFRTGPGRVEWKCA